MKYNPERKSWKGRSYKAGGRRIADLKDKEVKNVGTTNIVLAKDDEPKETNKAIYQTQDKLPKYCCKNVGGDGPFKPCGAFATHWYTHSGNAEEICSFCDEHNYVCGIPINDPGEGWRLHD